MSAKLPPPKRVLAHAHWTMSKSKMSKSRGNVVNPIQAMEKWGVDGVRWYLMRIGGSLAADAGEWTRPPLARLQATNGTLIHYTLLITRHGSSERWIPFGSADDQTTRKKNSAFNTRFSPTKLGTSSLA